MDHSHSVSLNVALLSLSSANSPSLYFSQTSVSDILAQFLFLVHSPNAMRNAMAVPALARLKDRPQPYRNSRASREGKENEPSSP